MKYSDNGPVCPATCAEPNAEEQCEDDSGVSGCFCTDGRRLSGGECVLPMKCGCTDGGQYYKVSLLDSPGSPAPGPFRFFDHILQFVVYKGQI